MIKVYCYSRCTTCKKALKWLDDNGVKYQLIDIKEDHHDEKTLRQFHKKSGLSLRKFFNTSGQLYRSMELKDKLNKLEEIILGYGQTGNFIASDVTAILRYTRDVVYMDDGEIAVVTADSAVLREQPGTGQNPVVQSGEQVVLRRGDAVNLYPSSETNLEFNIR